MKKGRYLTLPGNVLDSRIALQDEGLNLIDPLQEFAADGCRPRSPRRW